MSKILSYLDWGSKKAKEGISDAVFSTPFLILDTATLQNRLTWDKNMVYQRNPDGTYKPVLSLTQLTPEEKAQYREEYGLAGMSIDVRIVVLVLFIALFGLIVPLWLAASALTAILIFIKYRKGKNFRMTKFGVATSIIFGPIYILEQVVMVIFWRYF